MAQQEDILEAIILIIRDQTINNVEDKTEAMALIPYFAKNIANLKRFNDTNLDTFLQNILKRAISQFETVYAALRAILSIYTAARTL